MPAARLASISSALEVAAGAGVARRKLGGDLLLAYGFELFGGAEAAVGGAVGEQEVAVLAVDFGAFGLAVGAVGAADVGAFVPGEAEPAEGVEDHLLGGGDEAGAVGVFDAEDELAAALARVDVVDQADVGGADVGVAGGAGSDADADGGFGINRHKGQELMLAEEGDRALERGTSAVGAI